MVVLSSSIMFGPKKGNTNASTGRMISPNVMGLRKRALGMRVRVAVTAHGIVTGLRGRLGFPPAPAVVDSRAAPFVGRAVEGGVKGDVFSPTAHVRQLADNGPIDIADRGNQLLAVARGSTGYDRGIRGRTGGG